MVVSFFRLCFLFFLFFGLRLFSLPKRHMSLVGLLAGAFLICLFLFVASLWPLLRGSASRRVQLSGRRGPDGLRCGCVQLLLIAAVVGVTVVVCLVLPSTTLRHAAGDASLDKTVSTTLSLAGRRAHVDV